MQKVHPGQEVVSVFGIATESKKDNAKLALQHGKQRLVLTLITAFFIVFAAAAVLNYMNQRFEGPAVVESLNEPVAYQPGQYVSNEIFKGYTSK